VTDFMQSPGAILPGNPKGAWQAGMAQSSSGSRKYKMWVPVTYDAQRPSALILMLHGCTQTAEDFAALSGMNQIADRETFLAVYPEQSRRANFLKCWNWFDPHHQARDAGEPSILAEVVAQVQSTHNIDSERIYVAGASAGGAMAVVLGVTYPDLFAAIGVTAGVEFQGATSRSSGFALMRRGGPDPNQQGLRAFEAMAVGLKQKPRLRIPLIAFHGGEDSHLNPVNADQLIAQWAKTNQCLAEAGGVNDPAGLSEEVVEDSIPGGRSFTRHRYRDAAGLLMEKWIIHGMGHAWSGGPAGVRHADPKGPNTSEEIWRFFCATSPAPSRRNSESAVRSRQISLRIP
jgi:poly(hydroxyalkanoate) depolymerase family esterase